MPSQDTQIAMIEGIDFCHGDVQDMPCENKVQAGILAKKLLNDQQQLMVYCDKRKRVWVKVLTKVNRPSQNVNTTCFFFGKPCDV